MQVHARTENERSMKCACTHVHTHTHKMTMDSFYIKKRDKTALCFIHLILSSKKKIVSDALSSKTYYLHRNLLHFIAVFITSKSHPLLPFTNVYITGDGATTAECLLVSISLYLLYLALFFFFHPLFHHFMNNFFSFS